MSARTLGRSRILIRSWMLWFLCAGSSTHAQSFETSPADIVLSAEFVHEIEIPEGRRVVVVAISQGNVDLLIPGSPDSNMMFESPSTIKWAWIPEANSRMRVANSNGFVLSEFRIHIEAVSDEDDPQPLSLATQAASISLDTHAGRLLAIDLYRRALSRWPPDRWSDLRMAVLSHLSQVLHREGRNSEALETLKILIAAGDLTPRTLIGAAAFSDLTENREQSRSYLCRALETLSEIPDCSFAHLSHASFTDDALAADALNRIGLSDHRKGELSGAARWYRLALNVVPEWAPGQKAIIVNNLGGLRYVRGDLEEALYYLHSSLEMSVRSKALEEQAMTLSNIGGTLKLLGDYDGAIDAYRKSLAIYNSKQAALGQARVLTQIGSTYLALNQLEDAELVLLEAEKTGAEDEATLAGVQVQLGHLEELRGDPQAAHDRLVRALQILRQSERHPEALNAQQSIAALETRLGAQDAMAQVTSAIQLAMEIQDDRALGRLLSDQGELNRRAGSYDSAKLDLSRAIGAHVLTGDVEAHIRSLFRLALTEADSGCLTCAVESLQDAESVLREARRSVSSARLRASHAVEYVDLFSKHIELLVQLGQVSQALEVALNNRTQVLLESILYRDVGGNEDVVEARRLKRLMAVKSESKARIHREWPGSEELRLLDNEISKIARELDAIESRKMTGRVGNTPRVSVDQLRQELADGSMILAYWVGADAAWVWLVSAEAVLVREIPAAGPLSSLVNQVRLDIVSGVPYPSATVLELSSTLLPDFGERFPEKLLVIPDGPVNRLPVSALLTEERVPLISLTDIVITPVAVLLGQDRDPVAAQKAVVVSDPVFSADDPRVEIDAVSSSFERLPQTAEEAAAVKRYLADMGYSVDSLSAFRATKEEFLGLNVDEYSILHFATHGLVDDHRPELSGLVFSLTDDRGRSIPGLLSLDEIYDLRLRADLVVLSACKTAVGKEVVGEGPISLARGFIVGGSRQVVASLWPVPDRATAMLMDRFYENMAAGFTAIAALHRAQRELMKVRRWSGPLYWSGFVVVSV